MAGFTWAATRDGKTIVRVGAGRYFDPASGTNASNLLNERQLLSPLGTGRLTVSGANILWNGRPLQFRQPTPFTGADLLAVLPAIRSGLEAAIAPDNRDYSVRNLDRTKEGANLYDPWYSTPSAVHVGIGIQRELPAGIVVSADVVWKRFADTYINGIDYNRWNSARGPGDPAVHARARGPTCSRPARMAACTSTRRVDGRVTPACSCAPSGGWPTAPSSWCRTRSAATRAPTGPAPARRSRPAGASSGSTTTTGTRTTVRCRPTSGTS